MGKRGVVSHKVRKVKEVEWLLQALMGPSEDIGLYLSEMGAGEGRDLVGFNKIPLAAASRTVYP